MGLILELSALTYIALIVLSNGKAVPEKSPGHDEGARRHLYSLQTDNAKDGSLTSAELKFDYYNPQIDGQPIYIPQITGGRNKIHKSHGKRRKNPVHQSLEKFRGNNFNEITNNDANGEYYENPVVLNSMSKNIHGKTHEDKAYCPNCHIATEYDKIKHHGSTQGVNEKDQKSKDAIEKLLLNSYEDGESSESSENSKEFPSNSMSVVPEDSPEVVDVINKNMRGNAIIISVPDTEYDEPLVEVLTKKIYETSVKLDKGNVPYTSPGIAEDLKRKNDKLYETQLKHLPITSGYATEPAITKVTDEIFHKASSSGVNYYTEISLASDELPSNMSKNKEAIASKADEFSNLDTPLLRTKTKKVNKDKHKKCSKITSERTKIDLNCIETQQTTSTEKAQVDKHTPETVSTKTQQTSTEKAQVYEHTPETASTETKHKYSIVKYEYYPEEDDIDKNEESREYLDNTLKTPDGKSSYENLYSVSGKMSQEQSTDFEHMKNIKERSNIPRKENEFLDSLGSGESTFDVAQSFEIDKLRSLSWLNSNIWPLIFNPNAKEHKLNKCVTRNNDTGYCTYLQNCPVPNMAISLEQLLSHACVLDEVFIGVCCPEFPVETVKVHWEDLENAGGEKIEEKLNHDIVTEGEFIKSWCDGYEQFLSNLLNSFSLADCGTRSEVSGALSWSWKAPLVSMSNGKTFCGGATIGERYVLTAAHCTTKIPKNQILVRLGQHNSSGEDFAVTEIKRHAQYNPRTMLNDIALLKLGRSITHYKNIGSVCLPKETNDRDAHAGTKGTLLGWQRSLDENSEKAELLEIMGKEECRKKLKMSVPHSMLCTEARNEDERTCNADSGAPLVIEDDGRYEVIGILSWNRNDCDQRFPSTFSRVSSYLGWIQKHAV